MLSAMADQLPVPGPPRAAVATLRLSERRTGDFDWDGEAGQPLGFPGLYAGVVWRRAVAYMVDVIVIGGAVVTLWTLATVIGTLSFGLLSPLVTPAVALAPLAYHTVFAGSDWAATPGMRLFNLQARTVTGERLSYAHAALWTIAFYVTVGLTSWLVLIVALFNMRRRTLHDFLCGVLVLNARRPSGVPQRV
ncbi:MAG: RDD family protein [Alphaproteobacteria bacterium]|nr:RDD family protein [Alphaproteobacteria bacterium]